MHCRRQAENDLAATLAPEAFKEENLQQVLRTCKYYELLNM